MAIAPKLKPLDVSNTFMRIESHVSALEQVQIASLSDEQCNFIRDRIRLLQIRLNKLSNAAFRQTDFHQSAAQMRAINEAAMVRAREQNAAKIEQLAMIGEKNRVAVRKEEDDRLFSAAMNLGYSLKIRGTKLGEIWSNEFDAYYKAGAFEASLFDQLRKHARTSKPVKVKNLVSMSTLVGMIETAEKVSGGVYTS